MHVYDEDLLFIIDKNRRELSLNMKLKYFEVMDIISDGATPSCRRPPRTRRPRGHEGVVATGLKPPLEALQDYEPPDIEIS